MRAHWFRASSSVVALLLGMATAHAQDAAGTTTTTKRTVTTSGTATPAGTELEVGGVGAQAAVTPDEQIEQANQIVRRAVALAERLSKMLDEARREKDIMRANCVNRKLTEVNANTRNVEQRAAALRAAAQTNDEARRSHEYTVLTVLSQKLTSLDQEATQCLGQSLYEPGASQIVTLIPGFTSTFADPSTVPADPSAPPSVVVPPGMSDASPSTPTM
jgi:hypothetical protein